MGFLATLAFLGFGWVTFDGAIMKREDPNHALTVAAGVDEWVLRRNRNGHYFSPGLINGQPVRFLLDTGATRTPQCRRTLPKASDCAQAPHRRSRRPTER